MSILINKDTKVITQGITGKTGQFHTRMGKEYANGPRCYVAGVTPKKGGQSFEGIPIYETVREAKQATGATVSVIYVPPPYAAAAIDEAVDAELDLVICILENLRLVLTEAGASFADVLKVTVYLTDIGDRTLINPVREEFFGDFRPASTLVEVSALALAGMRVEIEAVVGLPSA